jgi:hypothetical protein
MNHKLVVIVLAALGLAACGRDTANVTLSGKEAGPAVSTMSHDQLMAAYHECTQYGPIDDRKVKYTVRYCAAIQSAHLSEGYTAPGAAKVDPTLNKMH